MARHEVKSPIPGTFYRKPAPDQPPFAEIGQSVAKGDTVGLVEVMKTFHEVKADADGMIVGFPVADSDPVMAGQTIVELD
ncbi:MAG: biotin carboxyl carrier domain-containing protein [Alphaproteobacteria bacterium]|uniref:acetyl-CoA carboxylase n=1 Tax=Stappia TaxID=152161 RepID=UPI001CD5574C|nr:acetyl-CoA carboxylase [Stappia stellulata]MBL6431031.1 biotin carboxyl carrier domain-containing protein [Alphaproteobacteria bacterium]MCA1242087.1 biotin carboxyl carrier domain-containing protein [Stappia stellulata]